MGELASYVIDDGKAIGPIALVDIARSISNGERSDECYVWWRGATEWMPFNSDERLVMLLAGELDETEEVETAESEEEEMPPVIIELAPEASSAAGDISNDAIDVREVVEPAPLVIDVTDTVDIRNSTTGVEEASLDSIAITENTVLANVGARLEALASSTRHLQESTKLDRAGASPVESPAHARGPVPGEEEIDLRSSDSSDSSGDDGDQLPPVVIEFPDDPSEVRATTNEARFDRMVRQTIYHERLLEQSERVRELLARACRAAIGRHGFTVERRSDAGGHYYLGFENGVDTRRVHLEISPAASVSGDSEQNVHIVVSWGRMAFDITEALRIVQAQLPISDRRPGMISCDAELDNGSVSTRVELVWAMDSYVGNDYAIDHDKLEGSLDAILHALEQRWYELFIPAE